MFEEHHERERPRVVVGTVALGTQRDITGGMLHHPGGVGESPEMIENRFGGRAADTRRRGPPLLDERGEPGATESLCVPAGDAAPHHPAAEQPALLPHRMAADIVAQQIRDRAGDGGRVAKGHEQAAAVGQQFCSMAVGSGDHCLAAAKGIGQCARRDLVFGKVRRHVDVGGPNEGEQFVHIEIAVVKDHLVGDAKVGGQGDEGVTVPLPLVSDQAGMGRPGDEVDGVRVAGHDLGHGADHVLDALVG